MIKYIFLFSFTLFSPLIANAHHFDNTNKTTYDQRFLQKAIETYPLDLVYVNAFAPDTNGTISLKEQENPSLRKLLLQVLDKHVMSSPSLSGNLEILIGPNTTDGRALTIVFPSIKGETSLHIGKDWELKCQLVEACQQTAHDSKNSPALKK